MGSPPAENTHRAAPLPFDRERFLSESNAALRRIERGGLLILAAVGILTLLFFGAFGASMMIGGILGMFNFRSLHRMFQRRLIDPSRQREEKLVYSLKLFLIVATFFYMIQSESVSVGGILIGFFLITGAVFLETMRR
ncbi:MAG: ATP synthase subunit I [Candidatus Manganitrophaceae bacterium]